MLTDLWLKLKDYLLWLVMALVALVDPGRIDELAARHHPWTALIVALWGLLDYWVGQQKPQAGGQR